MNSLKWRNGLKALSIFIVSLVIVLVAFLPTPAEASIGSGTGSPISGGGVAPWWFTSGPAWTGSGTTAAWQGFESKQYPKRSASYLKSEINNMGGQGGFNGDTLYDSCRKSQYIWWYGEGTSRTYPGALLSYIGVNAHTGVQFGGNPDAKETFDRFLALPRSQTGWDKSGGTVLVCSGAFNIPEPIRNITVTANSGSYKYDGKSKTVSGFKLTSGSLGTGHSINAAASRTATNPSTYTVNFTKTTTVRDSSNSNVSSKYNIREVAGKLTIVDQPTTVTSENCRTAGSETITAIIQNDVTVSAAFLPSGAPRINTMTKEKTNAAYTLSQYGQLPKIGQSKSTWNTWATKYANGGKGTSNLSTYSVDLEGGPAQIISEHGGVLNVNRIHNKKSVRATFCQPQTRDGIVTTDKNGKKTTTWGPYYDIGQAEITSVTQNENIAPEVYSYQIIGANCNADGMNRVKNEFSINEDLSLSNGVGSGLLVTNEVSGSNLTLGRTTHYTGKNSFYKPDGTVWRNSCQDQFVNACVSDKLSTASNDSNNNNNAVSNPLFTHESSEYNNPDLSKGQKAGQGYPNLTTEELIFFRDNEDRTVRAEVFYPKQSTVSDFVTYPKAPAKETRAILYGGTPEASITTIHGIGYESKPLKNIDEVVTMNGHVNKFNMKSQWASEQGKPYEIGVDWKYNADAKNVMATTLDGKGVLSSITATTRNIDVHCQFRTDKGSYPAVISKNPYLKPSIDSSDFSWDESNAVRALFTRSVSDKSQ